VTDQPKGPGGAGAQPTRRSRQREQTHAQIYEAALRCFARIGIADTVMDDIAKEADISRQAIYYHFSDKQALLIDVVAHQVRAVYEAIRDRLPADPTLDTVIDAMVLVIRSATTDPYVSMLVQPDTAALAARLVDSDVVMSLRKELWLPLLSQLRDRGLLRDDVDLTDIIRWITMTEFAVVCSGTFPKSNDERAIRAQLQTFLLPALRAGAGHP
jgi:AcrR family transcriptional regulator